MIKCALIILQTALLMKFNKPMMKFHPHHDENLQCHLQENPVLETAFDKVFANPAESNLPSLPKQPNTLPLLRDTEKLDEP